MSPRKKKQRHCSCPMRQHLEMVFKPAGIPLKDLAVAILGRDELEALYLCDSRNFNQEKAGELMGVSRGTVQRLLAQGRKKVVEALVEGRALAMEAEEGLNVPTATGTAANSLKEGGI